MVRIKHLFMISALLALLGGSCQKSGVVKVVDGLDFPEGPAWDGQGHLYLSNCHGGWIAKVENSTAVEFLKASEDPFTFRKTNGLTVRKDGLIFACEYGVGAILKIHPQGNSEIYVKAFSDSAFSRPNDLAFDAKGGLYFTDPNSYDADKADGYVYRIDPQKNVDRVAGPLAFPNGIAVSPDQKKCYVCESARHRILMYTIKQDGHLKFNQVFFEFNQGDPDGIAFDRAGSLYVALFGGGAVAVIDTTGRMIDKIPMPGKNPTNVEFGGPDLKTLFITEVETNALYKIKVKKAGLPLYFSPMRKN